MPLKGSRSEEGPYTWTIRVITKYNKSFFVNGVLHLCWISSSCMLLSASKRMLGFNHSFGNHNMRNWMRNESVFLRFRDFTEQLHCDYNWCQTFSGISAAKRANERKQVILGPSFSLSQSKWVLGYRTVSRRICKLSPMLSLLYTYELPNSLTNLGATCKMYEDGGISHWPKT